MELMIETFNADNISLSNFADQINMNKLLTNRFIVTLAIIPGVILSVITASRMSSIASILSAILSIWILLLLYQNTVLRFAKTNLAAICLYIFFILFQMAIFLAVVSLLSMH